MSISLPNGTILAAPSSSTVQLSAAVTRILHLANFSADLKTRDLQNMFKDWETEKGGFRIKWLDDVNALVVFADASIAKRAYLSLLLHPPPQFSGLIRPYDRPDAAQIIQSLAARSIGHRSTASGINGVGGVGGGAGSISTFPFPSNNDPATPQVHSRAMSVTNPLNKSGSISISHNHNSSGSISGNHGQGHVRGVTAPQRINNNGNGSISFGHSGSGSNSGSISNTIGGGHHRTSSASSSWNNRGIGGGIGGGALNFSSAPKLATHTETTMLSRSTSESDGEPNVVILDPSATQGMKTSNNASHGHGHGHGHGQRIRRESVSAEKALREVEKALASVEAQG
ncbi:uncharacterized protein IL334_000466 [Kwoniella shivajii]|uniref:Anti-proliferative protein domain-containing protein n=1 Tax=Kwoniella shivajii TaxID=564305 RepID=A0ABZ1CSA0_9TREE|nr:hypothetical protein IL334_000466 [Kwoniella shivajii]